MNSFLYRSFAFFIFFNASLWSFGQSEADFYNTEKIQDISITFPQNNWRYLLDSLRYNGDELLAATVLVNGRSFTDAGVRYRDGATFTPGGRRNSLFIDLDIRSDEKYAGVGELDLSAATRDPSMAREVVGYELARKYFPAPRANYAKVKINGDYYGLLVNVEVVNSDFVERNFGKKSNGVFYAEPNTVSDEVDCKNNVYGTLKKDKSEDCLQFNFTNRNGKWSDLYQLTTYLKDNPDEIEKLLDVDQVLWMLAYNNVFLNLKSYSGKYSYNYYLVRPENGRFSALLGKLNLSFGSYKNTGVGSDLKPEQLIRLSVTLHGNNKDKPLIHVLLSNETYKKYYIAHVRTIMADIKKYNLKKRVEQLHALIYPDFVNDKNRYYSTQDLNNSDSKTIGKRSKIPGIVTLVQQRRSFLKGENLIKIIPPKATEVTFEHRKQFSNVRVNTFKIQVATSNHAKNVFIHYRLDDTGGYKVMKLKDDGKHFDGAAGDKVFGIEIIPGDKQSSLEYFLTVENANALSFYPSNYQQEKAVVTLAELN